MWHFVTMFVTSWRRLVSLCAFFIPYCWFLLQFLLISMCCVPDVWCFKTCHEQVMSVVVSPLNVFRASSVAFCHDDWRLLSPLGTALRIPFCWFLLQFLLISVCCVAFCHDVWRLLTPVGFALRLFHPILLIFVANLVDIYVLCASCLVFQGMSWASGDSGSVAFESFQSKMWVILSRC